MHWSRSIVVALTQVEVALDAQVKLGSGPQEPMTYRDVMCKATISQCALTGGNIGHDFGEVAGYLQRARLSGGSRAEDRSCRDNEGAIHHTVPIRRSNWLVRLRVPLGYCGAVFHAPQASSTA